MLKKSYKYLGVFVLVLFSFYYTDKAVDIVKRNDPIMKSILKVTDDYEVSSVNAIIEGDTIIPGVNGVSVDIDESYKKMKKLEGYYESLLMFKDVIPEESILNTFDKFVVKGNPLKNEIAIILKVTNIANIDKINKILQDKETSATFFIDGTVIENNMDLVENMISSGYQIENYGYDNEYNDEMFNWTNNMLYSLTNIEPKFCYSEYNDYDLLEMCKKSKMYTVKPNIIVKDNPYYTIKENIEEGSIISLSINEATIKELPTIISYIKQKGFDIVTLSELISEER